MGGRTGVMGGDGERESWSMGGGEGGDGERESWSMGGRRGR